jgi:hypothetical protein
MAKGERSIFCLPPVASEDTIRTTLATVLIQVREDPGKPRVLSGLNNWYSILDNCF